MQMDKPIETVIKACFAFLVCFLFSGNTYANQDTLKVLFVGNSYTYFWNLPQTVQAMAEEQGIPIITRQSTAGGQSLKNHWNGDKELRTRELISNNKWDYVILQNHSMSTIDTPEEFAEYGKKFIDLARESGATPLLYMTWAREKTPETQRIISKGYEKLGKKQKIEVVPVGVIWSKIREKYPEYHLFVDDGSHPSVLGTYLIANVFYAFLTSGETKNIPNRIISQDKDGEKLYLSIITEEQAINIHHVIDEYFKFAKSNNNE